MKHTLSILVPVVLACSILALAAFDPPGHAEAPAVVLVQPKAHPVHETAPAVQDPQGIVQVEAPTVAPVADPLADELTRLLSTFVPSYPDHEPAADLAVRRSQIAQQIAAAARGEFPDDPATARSYAVLLTYIGQRESRYALAVQKLGNQDNGAAHGAWQIHTWKDENPYLASTAMNMLHEGPGNWALPKVTPWVGYPPAAAYLASHPR